jgi:RNA polymerase sigma-70 factor, ECF subfamily
MPPLDGGPDDCELLRRMADTTRDLAARREAWGVFYERHAPSLARACAASHAKLIGIDKVPDAVSDTFLRAYDKAATFKLSGASPADQQRAVRAWLMRISENIVRDYFRNSPMVAFVEAGDLDEGQNVRQHVSAANDDVPDSRLNLVEEGLKTLSDREQRVLRETVFWYADGAVQQRMPHAAMQKLASELDTTPANIRQLRVRALAKLRQYVLDRS